MRMGTAPLSLADQQAELVMRNAIIGEPFATQLDILLADIPGGSQVVDALAALLQVGAARFMNTALEQSRIDNEVNARLGAMGVV